MTSGALSILQREATSDEATLPAWPLGWYVVARSSDLARQAQLQVTLASRECVLFRTKSGVLGAVDAHCPHMGAHLRHGSVEGEALVCPLHRWKIAPDGSATGMEPGCRRARTWHVEERFGLIFLHLGSHVRTELPAPEQADRYAWGTSAQVTIDTDWHCLAVNGFDMPHLHAVHHRKLVEPAQITVTPREKLTLRYTSRVTGRSLSDLAMRWLAKDRIHVRQQCFGPVVVVETDLGFTKTTAVLGLLPEGDHVRAFGAFGILPGRLTSLRLLLTRILFTAFLRRDFRVVAGMRLRTDVADEGVRRLASFLRSLPRLES